MENKPKFADGFPVKAEHLHVLAVTSRCYACVCVHVMCVCDIYLICVYIDLCNLNQNLYMISWNVGKLLWDKASHGLKNT